MDRLQQSLQKLFGFELFRPKQRDVIELILKKRHTLAVLPTGLGKSLCYQLTAQLQSGITLVISPLIALMQDQVDGLMRHGIKNATFISSTLDPSEVGARYKDIEKGKYNLLYVAPERFDSLRFQEIIRKTNIDLLVIDEAHCISKWGHDFRPHYRTLSQRLPEIKHSTILALTATATPAVQDDIIKTLNQPNMERIIGDFNRPNLHLEVFRFNRRKEKDEKLIELLSDEKGSVIIYSSTIKETRIVFDLLRNYEFNVSLYHGRLNSKDRIQAHYDFQNDKTQIIIATVAFGMGIDKPDIRRIIHYNIPGSLESYYQEIGRAGRDGKPAICTLLFLQNDLRVQRFFIDQAYPKPEQIFAQYKIIHEAHPLPVSSEDIAIASGYIELSVNSALHMLYEQDFIKIMPDGKYLLMRPEIKAPSIDFKPFDKRKAQDNSRLRKMISYTDYKTCKRQHILSYFEQDFIPPCNNCDVCTPQKKGLSVKFSEKETEKATTESDSIARTILQAVCDFGGRLGRTTISDTLFGSKRKQILNFKLNRARAYGQLQSYGRRLILKWVDELIYMDLLYVTAEEYPKLKITDKGLQALKNETLIALSDLEEKLKKIDVISIQDEHITVTSTERRENIEFNSQLYEKLRDWRLQKTKSLKLPAYCILHNSTLKEITRQCPCRLEELKYIKGIGKRKMEQFGSEIIDLIKNNIESIAPKSATINKYEPFIDERFSKKQSKKSYKQEIIKLLREGKLSSKEIADKVGVSPPTIWAYKAHLTMGKYDKISDREEDFEVCNLFVLGENLDAENQKKIEDLLYQLQQEKKSSPKKVIKILNKLALLGYEQAIPKLLKFLESDNAIIIKKAAEVLGQLRNKEVIPGLERLLSDRSPIIRRIAVELLGKLGAKEIKAKLRNMSRKDESEYVRLAANDALIFINEIDSPIEEYVDYIKTSEENDHDYFINKVENSNISIRSKNVLKTNVKNVHSFLILKPFEMLRFKNCGRKSIREILQLQDELRKKFKTELNGSYDRNEMGTSNFGDWPLIKTNDKITDPEILEIRKKYRRAYEPWSDKEDDLLRQHLKENKSVTSLAKIFQRKPGAIRSRGKKIGLNNLTVDTYDLFSDQQESKISSETPIATDTTDTIRVDISDPFKNEDFVLIKNGSYMMGSPVSETGRRKDETLHKVTITKDFYVLKTQVTQKQWTRIMGDNPSHFRGYKDALPVENISWNDAQEFINRLNQIEAGFRYRLPTEAEWEYVVRAGNSTMYFFGDNDSKLEGYAWFKMNSRESTHPVGQKKPNPWGLYDIYGNVWEWCRDLHENYSNKAVIDPQGSKTNKSRIIRGGCWVIESKACRSANRSRINPEHRSNTVGFRLVKEFNGNGEKEWEPEDSEQKRYIHNKILELGSIKEVKRFYCDNSKIDAYARRKAFEIL